MQVIVEPAQWMHRCGNCRQQLQRIDGVQDLRPVRRQHADARALADAETRERLLIPARRITDIADAQHRSTQQLQQRTTGMRRSEEHTSELQSLMRNSYAVFCLQKTTE